MVILGSLERGAPNYVALAEQMNTPDLAGQVQFESGNDGNLLVYIDGAWRSASPAEQQQFALNLADRWAQMTGNPSAMITLADGHGTCFALAVAHSRVNGQPFYQPVNITATPQ